MAPWRVPERMEIAMQPWINARDRGLAILIWLVLLLVIFWLLSHIVNSLLLISLAGVLAYALTPAVGFLAHWLPRPVAIILVYILALGLIGALGYLIFRTTIDQITTFAQNLPDLLKPSTPDQPSTIARLLQPLGVTSDQFNQTRQQIINWAESSAGAIATQALPILTGLAAALVDLVLVIVMSIYLIIAGPRAIAWLRTATPTRQRSQTLFFLDTMARTVGGYIRGELFMAVFIGVLVGGGMALFGLPYALLLGVMAAFFEFVPILGTLVSGATCVLIALPTRGWIIALLVLGYFIVVHILEGDVVGPRVIGRVVGLHPFIAIVALVIGTELFGIWGAIFAAPVAGLLQSVLVAVWAEWRHTHPDQFEPPITGSDQALVAATPAEETVG